MQQVVENGSKLEQAILAPYTHLLQVKGKQLRTKIALSFNHWLRLPEEKLHQIVDTVAMLHVGTLLFDDVQDNASLRRGIPAAHRVFGTPLTINTSVHVLFLVLKKFLDLHTKALKENSFCEDISEGKFSLPVIHTMKSPERGQILSILRQRTEDVQLKRHCVYLLEQAGSLQYTRDVLEDLDRSARAEVARLGGNPDMEAILDKLMSWKD